MFRFINWLLILIHLSSVICIDLSSDNLKETGQLSSIEYRWANVSDGITQPIIRDYSHGTFSTISNADNNELIKFENRQLSLSSKLQSSIYIDLKIHKYDNIHDLKNVASPQTNQKKCLRELESLNKRSIEVDQQKMNSTDFNFYLLIDTFGGISSDKLGGNSMWAGDYNACLRAKIRTRNGYIPTRYCLANLRHANQSNQAIEFKVGVCLPKICDSSNYKNKYELIVNLIDYNSRELEANQSKVTNLYCLPDKDSLSRSFFSSPKAAIMITLLTIWFLILIISTIMYESSIRELNEVFNILKEHKPNIYINQIKFLEERYKLLQSRITIYEVFSVIQNLKLLFDANKSLYFKDIANELQTDQKSYQIQQKKPQAEPKVVDLSVLEGFKVIPMMLIISWHVELWSLTVLQNPRELAFTDSNFVFVLNLAANLSISILFLLNGILTCYIIMKQNIKRSFLSNPSDWVALIIAEYTKIMPIYILIIAYTKYLAKFMGSGPFWDYGTSSTGNRYRCEQESWLWVFSLGANFKENQLDHCLPIAWYIATDFQLFLITLFILMIIHKWQSSGRKLMILGIIIGLFGHIRAFMNIDMDLRSLVKLQPHGLIKYVNHSALIHTLSIHRIPAYFCGLLVGSYLYQYERGIIERLRSKNTTERPKLPDFLKLNGSKVCLALGALVIVFHYLLSGASLSEYKARLACATLFPIGQVTMASVVGTYCILAATGHGNRVINSFLCSGLWRPFARLNSCVLVVNMELIIYLYQTRTTLEKFSELSLLSVSIACIIAVYLMATIVCLLFEYPLRRGLNMLALHFIKQSIIKNKSD